jgi:1-deoxy-D-xylulose-5-phosphate reductoisomerase
MKQRIAILGSTGSVGTSTLEVLARHPDRFDLFALTASTRVDLMLQQCLQFKPRFAVMVSQQHAKLLADQLQAGGSNTMVLHGPQALCTMASHEQVNIVMAAIVGAAGLAPCLAAAKAGKRLLLANKEALVVGGEVFMRAVREGGATLLPIDSEHSAIFQSLPQDPASWADRVDKIILTASGGPFRTRDPKTLRDVTPEQACAHPNWVMGRKISVDSATMMNKALEVIEARFLFGLMPERIESGAAALDFRSLADLTFESLDSPGHAQRFAGLKLAWAALSAPSGTTAVLNAANEVAVQSFLDKQIRFDQILEVNLETLSQVATTPPQSLDDLLALDALSRNAARQIVQRFEA